MNTPLLMTDVMAAGGVRLAVMSEILSGSLVRDVENADRLSITASADTPWTKLLMLGQVVRFPGRNGHPALEMRISQIQDGVGADISTIQITADPLIMDLARSIIRRTVEGGRTWFDIGMFRSTAANYIDTFLVPPSDYPVLHLDGMTWIERGTIDNTDRFDRSWAKWTALQMLHACVEHTGSGEIELVNDDDARYLITIPERRGVGAPTLLLTLTRNLQHVLRDRNVTPLRTVMIASGDIPDGDAESASIGYAAFRITDISGNVLTLADPSAGSDDTPVIAFDNQLRAPMHVLKSNGTLTEIVASSKANQTVEVDDASGISVGDFVEIRADSIGTLLVELDNPALSQPRPDGFGRIMGAVDVPGARGERNHVRNSGARDWADSTEEVFVYRGVIVSASGSNVTIGGLPEGLVIKRDDLVAFAVNNGASDPDDLVASSVVARRVGTGGTVDSSGEVALVMVTTAGTRTAGDVLRVLINRYPDGWTAQDRGAVTNGQAWWRRDLDATGDVPCTLDNTATQTYYADLSDLPEGTLIQPGDVLIFGSVRATILRGGVVGVSGAISVEFEGLTNPTAGPATIRRPVLSVREGGRYVPQTFAGVGSSANRWLQTPTVTVRYSDDMPAVWAHVRFAVWNPFATSQADNSRAQLAVINADTLATVASVSDDDRTSIAAGASIEVVLRVQVPITSSIPLAIRFIPPQFGTGATVCMLMWSMISVGTDPSVPWTDSSYANRLWRAANAQLLKTPDEPATWRVTMRDLSRMGVQLEREEIVLGGNVRMIAQALNVDSQLRIMGITDDLVDPLNTELVLSRLTPRQSRQLAAARQRRQYVQIPVVDLATMEEATQVLPTSPTPPTDTDGSARGVVESGGEDTAPPEGAVPVVIWFRGGGFRPLGGS